MPADLTMDRSTALTQDGWQLELKRTYAPDALRPDSAPVLIVPGYGMNAFIFGFHPAGTSMERSLAQAGFEVWSVNLRGQGGSRPLRPHAAGPSLHSYVEQDLPAALSAVLAGTRTRATQVSLIGCSLGGSVIYAYLGLTPDAPVHAVCAIGAPLRWDQMNPALRTLFSSLAGRVRVTGTRRLAGLVLPLLSRFPRLLSIYMNPTHVDLSAAPQLVATVEDPHPGVDRDIARWVRDRDLVLRGRNVTASLARIQVPLLLLVSNRDGIVPREAALSARAAWGGADVQILEVGDDEDWYAHADLFIAHQSPRLVFSPIADWLRARGG